jgi:hypothetical protein
MEKAIPLIKTFKTIFCLIFLAREGLFWVVQSLRGFEFKLNPFKLRFQIKLCKSPPVLLPGPHPFSPCRFSPEGLDEPDHLPFLDLPSVLADRSTGDPARFGRNAAAIAALR